MGVVCNLGGGMLRANGIYISAGRGVHVTNQAIAVVAMMLSQTHGT